MLKEIYEVRNNQNDLTLFCLFVNCEPINFEKAAQSKKWINAMEEEIKAVEKNNTWELVSLPKGVKAIGVK